MAVKKKKFGEMMERLEELADMVENSETSIEDTVKCLKEASELSMKLRDKLNEVEEEIEQLLADN
jgi:exodeoxyribonuclease VII small subunit